MCGIYGECYADGRPVDGEAILGLARLLGHRGPDEEGAWDAPGVGLAVTRLAVLDRSGGKQPFTGPSGAAILAYNGESYNHAELRRELERKGRRFKTRSDTEVLVHLYEEHGLSFVERLDGMFALALWDSEKRRLILARDRFGIKPLYYAEGPGWIRFASEIQPLAGRSECDRQIDPAALQDYFLLGHVPHPRTIFRGIWKLPPGALLIWEGGASRLAGWQVPLGERPAVKDLRSALPLVDEALAGAVRAQLAADVPVGILLSGGIDSGLIAAYASRERPGIHAFTAAFRAPSHDETAWAAAVARHLGLKHRTRIVEAPDRERLLKILSAFGEPFADSSAVATWEVCRCAREEVTVALSGEGGDELFGGYAERYVWDPVASRLGYLPAGLRHAAGGLSRLVLGGAPIPAAREADRRLRKLLGGAGIPAAERYLHWFALFDDAARRTLLGDRYAPAVNPFSGAFSASEGAPPLERLLSADRAVTLPGDMLTKSDRASMAHGLELRVPFLSDALEGTARRLAPTLKVRRCETKVVLRALAREALPVAVAKRPKRGFEVPLAEWMTGPWEALLDDLWESQREPAGGIVKHSAIRELRRQLAAGNRHTAHLLYAVLAFDLWWERFVAQPAALAQARR